MGAAYLSAGAASALPRVPRAAGTGWPTCSAAPGAGPSHAPAPASAGEPTDAGTVDRRAQVSVGEGVSRSKDTSEAMSGDEGVFRRRRSCQETKEFSGDEGVFRRKKELIGEKRS